LAAVGRRCHSVWISAVTKAVSAIRGDRAPIRGERTFAQPPGLHFLADNHGTAAFAFGPQGAGRPWHIPFQMQRPDANVLEPATRRLGRAPRCRSWCNEHGDRGPEVSSSGAGYGPWGQSSSGSGRNRKYPWGSRRCRRCRNRSSWPANHRGWLTDVVEAGPNETGQRQSCD